MYQLEHGFKDGQAVEKEDWKTFYDNSIQEIRVRHSTYNFYL